MEEINQIISKETISIEELIICFEQVRKNGDIAVIKFDGERIENAYTILISFPVTKKREMIRVDEAILKIGLKKALVKYIELHG